MKSFKTAFVVVVMLVVVYGAWVMINKKPLAPPAGMLDGTAFNPPAIEFPGGMPSQPGASQFPHHATAAGGTVLQPPLTPGAPLPLSPPSGVATDAALGQPSAYSQSGTLGGTASANGSSPYGTPADGGAAAGGAPVIGADAYNAAIAGAGQAPAAAVSGWDNLRGGSASRPSVYGAAAAGQDVMPPAVDAASAAAPADSTAFLLAWRGAQDQLAKGELAGALETLTLWHDSDEVPADLRPQVTELLDQLAGAVIYSKEHLIEPPHEVRPGETLEDIASQLQVPWQLLANINGISDPAALQPGTRLKVIRGPFSAVIQLEQKELTLMAGRHYAGRFAIGLGNDPEPMTGEYVVREKAEDKTYYDRDGRAIAPGEDANPYGPFWIGLQGRLGIHGAAPAPQSGSRESTGSINVSADDARDLFAILSKDSRVIIRQ